MKVLVINCGSSSLKYQLIDMEGERVLCKGLCERIGIEGSKITHKANGGEWEQEVPFPTHTEAFMKVVEMMTSGEGAVVKDKSGSLPSATAWCRAPSFFTKSGGRHRRHHRQDRGDCPSGPGAQHGPCAGPAQRQRPCSAKRCPTLSFSTPPSTRPCPKGVYVRRAV